MKGQAATSIFGFLVVIILPALLTSAPAQSLAKQTPVLGQLNKNLGVRDNETPGSVDQASQMHHFGGVRRADPFAEYGHIRFGKRAPPTFNDYGHLRFGRRAMNGPNFKDYGHLRFGRSVGGPIDEADIYKHDFDDINDVE